jgi:putative signal transducing protein
MAVVAHFRDLAGAEVASTSLEAAGIVNVLADTQTIGVAWYYWTVLGGIRLHVDDADVAEARAVLEVARHAASPAECRWRSGRSCSWCGS